MNNRDEIDVLFPQYFTSEDNNEGPAEGMYRIDAGLNFGWPYCFFDYRQKKLLLNPEYGGDGKTQGRCTNFSPPIVAFPAHWAPVDLTFYEGKQFPAKYRGGALIAFHGSWNRKPEERPGAIVFQPFVNGKPSGKFEVFADGFSVTPVTDMSKYTGRPDGVAEAPDGSLYITDSVKGKVWRVFYRP
jgi:glucose/arabinose dehydrogenase